MSKAFTILSSTFVELIKWSSTNEMSKKLAYAQDMKIVAVFPPTPYLLPTCSVNAQGQ
jgi:hypothetical protein